MKKPGIGYTLASYVFEIPVEKRKSELSGEVVVSFHRGQYKLSTKNAIYSFGKNYTSFSIPFRVLNMVAQNIPAVLILGFGLGSVVDLLEKNKSMEKILAVDADPVIMELARKYLREELKNKIQFEVEDAEEFLQKNSQKFDLIIFDVFVDDKTPQKFRDEMFLRNLKNALNENGWLLYSQLDISFAGNDENSTLDKTFSTIFPEAFSIQADSNKIFCARN